MLRLKTLSSWWNLSKINKYSEQSYKYFSSRQSMNPEVTIFDKIVAKQIPAKIVYEDDLVSFPFIPPPFPPFLYLSILYFFLYLPLTSVLLSMTYILKLLFTFSLSQRIEMVFLNYLRYNKEYNTDE